MLLVQIINTIGSKELIETILPQHKKLFELIFSPIKGIFLAKRLTQIASKSFTLLLLLLPWSYQTVDELPECQKVAYATVHSR